MTKFFPEGILINTAENRAAISSLSALTEAMHEGRILEAIVTMCDSGHNLIVKLGDVRGVLSA